jgi:hypothetical protein
VPYFDLTVSAVKSVSVLHASYRVSGRQARERGDQDQAAMFDARRRERGHRGPHVCRCHWSACSGLRCKRFKFRPVRSSAPAASSPVASVRMRPRTLSQRRFVQRSPG